MPLSGHLRELRKKVGHDLLVLPSAAVALHDEQGRVLLGLHSDRQIWVLPGGLIEPCETPGDGAVRETWEETGLIVELHRHPRCLRREGTSRGLRQWRSASYVGTIFRGVAVGGKLRADKEEILELRYFSRAELTQAPHARWMDIALDAIFSERGPADFQRPTWKP